MNNNKEVKIQSVSPQEIADIVNAQSLNEAEKVITGGIFYNKPANDYVRNNIENIETIHDSMSDNVKTNPLYRLGKGAVDRINGFAYGLTGLPDVAQEFYNNIPRFGQQLQGYINNPNSMVNDTVDYFTNPYNDPLIPLDVAGIASVPASLGKLGGVAKVANTKPILNPKTNIPEITNGKTFAEITDKNPSDYINSSVKEYFMKNPEKLRDGVPHLGFGQYLINRFTRGDLPTNAMRSAAAKNIERNNNDIFLLKGAQGTLNPRTLNVKVTTPKLAENKLQSITEHELTHQALANLDNLQNFEQLPEFMNFQKRLQEITNSSEPLYKSEVIPRAVQSLQDKSYISKQEILDINNITPEQINNTAKFLEPYYNDFLFDRLLRRK